MATPASGTPEHRFGPYLYRSEQRVLLREGQPVPLVPKLLDTLHVLLEHRGRVVEKSELMERVWPDTVVEESGLARNISLLRKALGDEAELYIQTVPKRGYRFVAAEPQVTPPEVSPRRHELRRFLLAAFAGAVLLFVYWQFFMPVRLVPGGSRSDIAVLPFQSLQPVPLEISGSLDEGLVTALARIPGVRVLSPSTVRRYRAVRVPAHLMSRLLGMDAMLEGTIDVDSSVLRVTARLVDVHSGRIIWADRYARPRIGSGDPAPVAIASSIASDVRPVLSGNSALGGGE